MSDTEQDESKSLITAAKDTVLSPFYLAVSKPARRTYIGTALFFFAALFLLGTAISAYVLFYYAYIPARGFSRPIHLQFDAGQPPYGTVSLSKELVSGQPYDVKVILHMPHTKSNREAGNFMLDLQLVAPSTTSTSGVLGNIASLEKFSVLAHERRPAILTYYSPALDHVHKALQLPWYLTGIRQEAEVLDVDMMEGVEFNKGWRNIPTSARLEIQSDMKMQVYSASLVIKTRFQGLRYIMYKHRVASFVIFTGAFWTVEVISCFLAWLILSLLISSRKEESPGPKRERPGGAERTIKEEEDERDSEGLSDTSRTFPTFSGQQPLRYSSPRIKEEEAGETVPPDHPPGEADDEDEDEDDDFLLDEPPRHYDDSGLGTSMESSAGRRDALRRRRSGPFAGSNE
ncbi:hypothetical protein K402DRAFT_453962 [Aulographum hederae CBS 113979]|uniref:Uncharacterized protein n=1 Tax=Aulographum hederae CBS 113979 TaxID=1176131 RepID=A0A6G1H1R4_9PEZI|nr:hypothetical protein K402DRAFT_453962 [Aulographum hederae CBS 113979]